MSTSELHKRLLFATRGRGISTMTWGRRMKITTLWFSTILVANHPKLLTLCLSIQYRGCHYHHISSVFHFDQSEIKLSSNDFRLPHFLSNKERWSLPTPQVPLASGQLVFSSFQPDRRALTDNVSLWWWHKRAPVPEIHPGRRSEFPQTRWLDQNKAILHQLCHILSLKTKYTSLLIWQLFLWQLVEMTFFLPPPPFGGDKKNNWTAILSTVFMMP